MEERTENPYGVTASPEDVQRGPLSLPFTLSGCLNEEEARSACNLKLHRRRAIVSVLISMFALPAFLFLTGAWRVVGSAILRDPLSRSSMLVCASALVAVFFLGVRFVSAVYFSKPAATAS